MPGVQVGVYAGQETAGTEVSSTYEGKHLTVREDELIHPYIADGYVNKGDPVVLCDAGEQTTYGRAVGVAFNSGTAAADWIAIDTEGIWNLTVYAENDAGNIAIEIGDPLYIRADSLPGAADADGTGDAEISKIVDEATQVFFGYALGSMVAGGSGRIAVKIHASPWMGQETKRSYYTVTSGAYTYGKHHTSVFAGGQSTGLEYFDQQVTGTQTGEIYGVSTWIELAAGYTSITGTQTIPLEAGLYDSGATLTAGWVTGFQIQLMLASNPEYLYLIRANVANAGGPVDSVWQFANVGSCGYVAAAGIETSTVIGCVPWATIVGAGTGWIRLYDAAT